MVRLLSSVVGRPSARSTSAISVVAHLGQIGPVAASGAEQPALVDQVAHRQQIHHQCGDLEHRGVLGDLVDLQRNEECGRDRGQVLGPAPTTPQADALDELQRTVGEQQQTSQPQRFAIPAESALDQADGCGRGQMQSQLLAQWRGRDQQLLQPRKQGRPPARDMVGHDRGGDQRQALEQSFHGQQPQQGELASMRTPNGLRQLVQLNPRRRLADHPGDRGIGAAHPRATAQAADQGGSVVGAVPVQIDGGPLQMLCDGRVGHPTEHVTLPAAAPEHPERIATTQLSDGRLGAIRTRLHCVRSATGSWRTEPQSRSRRP